MSVQVRKKNPSTTGFVVALVSIVVIGGGWIYWKSTQKPTAVAVVLPTSADSTVAKAARGYTLGSDTAKIELVEFGDFECPVCGSYATITEPDVRKNLVATGIVRFTFYDYPITSHQNTLPAHMAAACADDQGKFWDMHDALYATQDEWNGPATGNPRGVITSYAQRIGLDIAKWNACMDASAHADRIKANYSQGLMKQVRGTPTFFVNGVALEVNHTYDNIKAAVDAALAPTRPIPSSEPPAAAAKKG